MVVNNDEKQVGTEDCGLFAIANCICLAERKSLSGNYDQTKMRLHLVNCIENLNLTVFPYVHAFFLPGLSCNNVRFNFFHHIFSENLMFFNQFISIFAHFWRSCHIGREF